MNKELRNISIEEFEMLIPEESKTEMKKLDMPLKWAYKEFLDLIRFDDFNVEDGIKQVIIGYLDELMILEANKYDYDVEA